MTVYYCLHFVTHLFQKVESEVETFFKREGNMAGAEEGKTGLNRFEALEQSIEQFIETSRQIGIIVSDFQPGTQGVLNQKM